MSERPLEQFSKRSRLLYNICNELSFIDQALRSPSRVLLYGRDWMEIRDSIQRSESRRLLNELARKKLIQLRKKETKNASHYEVALTQKGMCESLRLQVFNSDFLPKGEVCMVIFDVPEKHRRLRDQLRAFLKRAGFFPIQRSVWISPCDAGPALSALFYAQKARSWVRIYRATEQVAGRHNRRS